MNNCQYNLKYCSQVLDNLAKGNFNLDLPNVKSCLICQRFKSITQILATIDKRAKLTTELLNLTAKLTANTKLEDLLNNIYDEFSKHLPYDRIGVSLISEDQTEVISIWARSNNPSGIKLGVGFRAKLEGSSLENIIKSGVPRIINDLQEYFQNHPNSTSTKLILEEGLRSSLTCPLKLQGKAVGFIFFSSRYPNTYQEQHVEIFQYITNNLAILIEKTKAYQRLLELNELKNKFLGIAAHDLRNPIALITNYLDLLINTDIIKTEEEKKQIYQKMLNTAHHMQKLLEDLLDITAIESGNMKLEKIPTNIKNILLSAHERNSLLAKKKNINIKLIVPEDLPKITIDPIRISQVLDNLISNAIKFSYPNSDVIISVNFTQNEFFISVKDHGVGIPTVELSKLFKEFGKTSAKPTGNEKSTGLGLAIVKKIIDAHNGTIEVTSEVNKGSTFTIKIPIK